MLEAAAEILADVRERPDRRRLSGDGPGSGLFQGVTTWISHCGPGAPASAL